MSKPRKQSMHVARMREKRNTYKLLFRLEDLHVDGKIILKRDLKEIEC
jgi:hypothetical protein